jgi:hypothetical protein
VKPKAKYRIRATATLLFYNTPNFHILYNRITVKKFRDLIGSVAASSPVRTVAKFVLLTAEN